MSAFNTCFFERYALETLKRCLGREYYGLVNRDRPDLQSPDGKTWGIEVTRAMEESKKAAGEMIADMTGLTDMEADRGDMEQLISSGYGYGLNVGHSIGANESRYWSMAKPLKRILESKVWKMTNGFYGNFDHTGLYVFCKDALSSADIEGAWRKVMELQRYHDLRYGLLYLSEVSILHVCNLNEDLSDGYRVADIQIPPELRRKLYQSAFRKEKQ
ncbi:MAG: hypothetical protein J5699_06050 [Bacteroidales bacterium]|nr:hypothetical protein [Bacteroidales bacterium]